MITKKYKMFNVRVMRKPSLGENANTVFWKFKRAVPRSVVTGRGLKGLGNCVTAQGRIIVWQILQAGLTYRKLFNLLPASLPPHPGSFQWCSCNCYPVRGVALWNLNLRVWHCPDMGLASTPSEICYISDTRTYWLSGGKEVWRREIEG
jgi:hypothetical protein